MFDRSLYNIPNFVKGVQNPNLIKGEIRRVGTKINSYFHSHRLRSEVNDVMSEDWDNLIILDACRYDEYVKITGRPTSYKISNATESWDFMEKNYVGKDLYDTIYITSNPFASRINQKTFFMLDHLVDHFWDDDLGTVLPGDVVKSALKHFERYRNKKYIIHFMQPHYPFIGEYGKEINHRGYNPDQANLVYDAPNVWSVLQYELDGYPKINDETVMKAYEENLSIVLNSVEELLAKLPGKSVITSDHGTMIGDRILPVPIKGYGHAHGSFVPPVVKVPWDVREGRERREIKSGKPVESDSVDSQIINDRLESLGYRE